MDESFDRSSCFNDEHDLISIHTSLREAVMTRCEQIIRECMISCGWQAHEADQAIEDLKREAIESDQTWQQETQNLRSAIDDATEALHTTLYNLRNA